MGFEAAAIDLHLLLPTLLGGYQFVLCSIRERREGEEGERRPPREPREPRPEGEEGQQQPRYRWNADYSCQLDAFELDMLHISDNVSLMCKFSGEVEVKEAEVAAVERDGDAER